MDRHIRTSRCVRDRLAIALGRSAPDMEAMGDLSCGRLGPSSRRMVGRPRMRWEDFLPVDGILLLGRTDLGSSMGDDEGAHEDRNRTG